MRLKKTLFFTLLLILTYFNSNVIGMKDNQIHDLKIMDLEDVIDKFGSANEKKLKCGKNKCCIFTQKDYCLLIKREAPNASSNFKKEYENLKTIQDLGFETILIPNIDESKPVIVKVKNVEDFGQLGIQMEETGFYANDINGKKKFSIWREHDVYFFELFPTRSMSNAVLHGSTWKTNTRLRNFLFEAAYDFEQKKWNEVYVENLIQSIVKMTEFCKSYYVYDLQFIVSLDGKLVFMDVENVECKRHEFAVENLSELKKMLEKMILEIPTKINDIETYNKWLKYVEGAQAEYDTAYWYYKEKDAPEGFDYLQKFDLKYYDDFTKPGHFKHWSVINVTHLENPNEKFYLFEIEVEHPHNKTKKVYAIGVGDHDPNIE